MSNMGKCLYIGVIKILKSVAYTLVIRVTMSGSCYYGQFKIISHSQIRSILMKGSKYRFPLQIDFQKGRKKNCSIP